VPYEAALMRWETDGGAVRWRDGDKRRHNAGSGQGCSPAARVDSAPFLADSAPLDLRTPRRIGARDWSRFEQSLGEILTALGMDLETPATKNTPERFLRALLDATAGYEGDDKLLTMFPTECRSADDRLVSQIIEGPIAFHSLCEHHALPFHGVAHVGYVSDEHIIGISKLTRLVRLFARRFTLQERIGEQIADTLLKLIEPHGVAVHLEAEHLCTQMRGVREERSKSVMTFWRGRYSDDPELRRELLATVANHIT
jgi:GTP cyclohydrolase I